MNSFTKKAIEVRIRLSNGSFKSGGNTKVIRGLPVQVNVDKVGAPDINKASVKIWNMKADDMEMLTTLAFRPLEGMRNTVHVLAGDEDSELSTVFAGEITLAFANFSSAPEITFDITAMTGSYPMQIALPPTSIKDSAPVSDIIAGLADKMGYSFRNEGVTASIKSSVLCGSPVEQALAVARQAGAELIIDDDVVILLPQMQPRKGNTPILSKDTGLIGYPSFNDTGIIAKCIYEPSLQMGGKVRIKSIVPKATGDWRITKLTHSLTAYSPDGGQWESSIEGAYLSR